MQVAAASAASALLYFGVVLPLATGADSLGVTVEDHARVLTTSAVGPLCMALDAYFVRHRCFTWVPDVVSAAAFGAAFGGWSFIGHAGTAVWSLPGMPDSAYPCAAAAAAALIPLVHSDAVCARRAPQISSPASGCCCCSLWWR